MSNLTLEEVLEKYGEVEVTISDVYSRNVFHYVGDCEEGKLRMCVVDDILKNTLCKRLHLIEKVKDLLVGEYSSLSLNYKLIYS